MNDIKTLIEDATGMLLGGRSAPCKAKFLEPLDKLASLGVKAKNAQQRNQLNRIVQLHAHGLLTEYEFLDSAWAVAAIGPRLPVPYYLECLREKLAKRGTSLRKLQAKLKGAKK